MRRASIFSDSSSTPSTKCVVSSGSGSCSNAPKSSSDATTAAVTGSVISLDDLLAQISQLQEELRQKTRFYTIMLEAQRNMTISLSYHNNIITMS